MPTVAQPATAGSNPRNVKRASIGRPIGWRPKHRPAPSRARQAPAASAHSLARHVHPPIHPPVFAPLHLHLHHPLHETAAHLLIAGPLYRRQIPGHFLIFVLLDLDELGPAGPLCIQEPAQAVLVRRDARLHLVVDGAAPLLLLLQPRAPARAEALLGGTQLRRLARRQIQILLHALAEALLDAVAQLPRLRTVAPRRSIALLRRETRCQHDGQAENDVLLHVYPSPSRARSTSRSCCASSPRQSVVSGSATLSEPRISSNEPSTSRSSSA